MRHGGRTDSLKGNLPFGDEQSNSGVPFFVAGDVRVNEHAALAVMHTIWMRKHNRIVAALAKINPCWDDERLYQEGRKIVGAMMQVITYKEFLPLLLGEKGYNTFVGPYKGYSYTVDAAIPNAFASAAYRFGHSLVNPQFARLDKDYKPLPVGPLELRDSFFNPLQYFVSGGTDPILRGLLKDKSREMDEFLTKVLTTELFPPEGHKLGHDLAARNIQRGREHGIQSYRHYEKYCYELYGVSAKFANKYTEYRLKQVYGPSGFKDGIDLWVGGMAEETYDGSILGPTLSCINGRAFAELRSGDRFYWENPGVFTDYQRETLGYVRLSKVICNNADDIHKIVFNAFETGQDELYYENLPDLDLSLWKDTCEH